MGGVGPMFGQVGFFNKFAGEAYENKRLRDRYATDSARLLGVLDARLAGCDWMMGADYSIADTSVPFTKRASSSASTAFLMCRRGSTVASRVQRCSAGCKSRRSRISGAFY